MTEHQSCSLAECYYCAENNATWCKLCQKAFCENDHKEELETIQKECDYLDWHTYYNMEFLGVKF